MWLRISTHCAENKCAVELRSDMRSYMRSDMRSYMRSYMNDT
jgi:hypothetical protein